MKNKTVEQLSTDFYPKRMLFSEGYITDMYKNERDAFIKGYEEGLKNKWVNVKDRLPDTDRLVLVWVNNTQVPRWSKYGIGTFQTEKWYLQGGRESHEIVERWMEISQ